MFAYSFNIKIFSKRELLSSGIMEITRTEIM